MERTDNIYNISRNTKYLGINLKRDAKHRELQKLQNISESLINGRVYRVHE